MNSIGILAYGSLINDPGEEISNHTIRQIDTKTPFPVEYGRYSKTRGNAPTVVPHIKGGVVKAKILVLYETVTFKEASDLLWRRETRRTGSYQESSNPNAVLVEGLRGYQGISQVIYTDFHNEGKITDPNPHELAEKAIKSVKEAPPGKDGISYLIELINFNVITPLTNSYKEEILIQTGIATLQAALEILTAKRG